VVDGLEYPGIAVVDPDADVQAVVDVHDRGSGALAADVDTDPDVLSRSERRLADALLPRAGGKPRAFTDAPGFARTEPIESVDSIESLENLVFSSNPIGFTYFGGSGEDEDFDHRAARVGRPGGRRLRRRIRRQRRRGRGVGR
jgi:hypothetical protein